MCTEYEVKIKNWTGAMIQLKMRFLLSYNLKTFV